MTKLRSYPAGVTSWVEIAHEDLGGASAFYAELFGWTFTEDPSPGEAGRYLVAQLDGLDAAGILGSSALTRARPGGTPTSPSTTSRPQPRASKPPAGTS